MTLAWHKRAMGAVYVYSLVSNKRDRKCEPGGRKIRDMQFVWCVLVTFQEEVLEARILTHKNLIGHLNSRHEVFKDYLKAKNSPEKMNWTLRKHKSCPYKRKIPKPSTLAILSLHAVQIQLKHMLADYDLTATLNAHQWGLAENFTTLLSLSEQLTVEVSSSEASTADVIAPGESPERTFNARRLPQITLLNRQQHY